jgi:hypothetical protein
MSTLGNTALVCVASITGNWSKTFVYTEAGFGNRVNS